MQHDVKRTNKKHETHKTILLLFIIFVLVTSHIYVPENCCLWGDCECCNDCGGGISEFCQLMQRNNKHNNYQITESNPQLQMLLLDPPGADSPKNQSVPKQFMEPHRICMTFHKLVTLFLTR